MTLLFLAGTALAGPTVELPDALPRARRIAGAEFGGGAVLGPAGPVPSARVAVEGRIVATTIGASTAPYFASSATERFDRLWVKQNVYDRKRLHVAPFAHLVHHAGSQPADRVLKLRAGLALEGGGEHLRFDASITATGLGWYPSRDVARGIYALSLLDGVLPSEVGVSWLPVPWLRVRVGAWGPLPVLRVGYEGERLEAAAWAGALAPDRAAGELRLGFRY